MQEWERMGEDQSCKPSPLLSQAMNQPGASFTPLPSWAWETSLWLADCPIHLTNQKTVSLISLYHRIRKDKNFPDNKIFTVYGLSRQFFWMGQYCLIEEEEKLSEDVCKNFRVFWLWVTTAESKIRNAFLFFLSLVALHCTLCHPRWTLQMVDWLNKPENSIYSLCQVLSTCYVSANLVFRVWVISCRMYAPVAKSTVCKPWRNLVLIDWWALSSQSETFSLHKDKLYSSPRFFGIF